MMSSGNKTNWVGLAIFLVFVIGGSIYQQQRETKLLALPQKYVIGEVVNKVYPVKGDPIIEFIYLLHRTRYKRESIVGSYKVKVGERYFVSVPIITDDRGYIKDEDKGIILFDQPVPDSITSVPFGGWRELPVKSIQ